MSSILHKLGTRNRAEAPSGGSEPLAIGQAVNETNPGGGGGLLTFAILDEGGTSATGLIGWSVRLDVQARMVHCVLTLQLKGG